MSPWLKQFNLNRSHTLPSRLRFVGVQAEVQRLAIILAQNTLLANGNEIVVASPELKIPLRERAVCTSNVDPTSRVNLDSGAKIPLQNNQSWG